MNAVKQMDGLFICFCIVVQKKKKKKNEILIFYIVNCRKYVSSFRPSRSGALGSFLDLSGITAVYLYTMHTHIHSSVSLYTCIFFLLFLHLNGK